MLALPPLLALLGATEYEPVPRDVPVTTRMVALTYVRYVRHKLDMCGSSGLQIRYVKYVQHKCHHKSTSGSSQIDNLSYLSDLCVVLMVELTGYLFLLISTYFCLLFCALFHC